MWYITAFINVAIICLLALPVSWLLTIVPLSLCFNTRNYYLLLLISASYAVILLGLWIVTYLSIIKCAELYVERKRTVEEAALPEQEDFAVSCHRVHQMTVHVYIKMLLIAVLLTIATTVCFTPWLIKSTPHYGATVNILCVMLLSGSACIVLVLLTTWLVRSSFK